MSRYERLPTSPDSISPPRSRSTSPEGLSRFPPREEQRIHAMNRELQRQTDSDPRFNVVTPALWKRISLLIFVVFLFWLGLHMRGLGQKEDTRIVHANRYSKEHKFRPAASPVITEKLKDGRVRLRGAHIHQGL